MTTTENLVKTKWAIDPTHSEIAFKVKHLMITNVKGVFKEFEADINTEEDKFMTSDITLRISTASVDTGVADRDAHLRSADFFDSENFNRMTFVGKSYEQGEEEGSFLLHGDLTIRNITRPLKLNVQFEGLMKDPWGNQKAGYSINGKINRKEWELNWNAALEAGGMLVSDIVNLSSEIQLVKQS